MYLSRNVFLLDAPKIEIYFLHHVLKLFVIFMIVLLNAIPCFTNIISWAHKTHCEIRVTHQFHLTYLECRKKVHLCKKKKKKCYRRVFDMGLVSFACKNCNIFSLQCLCVRCKGYILPFFFFEFFV